MDGAPARLAPRGGRHLQLFGDDALYCESSHEPNDVLYSGSEDDYYDSPATRKLCYEAEARRFLRGKPPVLLSTALAGPFTKESGWKNPWKGKGACRHAPQQVAVVESEPAPEDVLSNSGLPLEIDGDTHNNVKLSQVPAPDTPSRLRSELSDMHDQTQSVLPSPPVSNNRYMDEDSLARVQSWRDNVQSHAAEKDEFWLPTRHGDLVQQSKKRQPNDEWLRRTSLKRRKPDVASSSFANSPSQAASQKRREQQFRSASSTRALTPNPVSSAAAVSTASRSFGLESWVNDDPTASQTRLSSRSGWPSLPSLPSSSGMHQSVLKGLSVAKSIQLIESSKLASKANSIRARPNQPRGMGKSLAPQSSPSPTDLKGDASDPGSQKPWDGSKKAETDRRRLVSKSIRSGRHRSRNPAAAPQEADQESPANLETHNENPPHFESQQDSSFCYHIKSRPHNKPASTADDNHHDQQPIEALAKDVPVSLSKDAGTSHDGTPEVQGNLTGDGFDEHLRIDGPTLVCFDSPIPSRYSVVKDRHSNGQDGGKDEVPRTFAEAQALSTDTMTALREEPTPADGDMVSDRYDVLKGVQSLGSPRVRNTCENEGDIPASSGADENIEGDTTLLSFGEDVPQTYAEVKAIDDPSYSAVSMETDDADGEATHDPVQTQWPQPGELRCERQVSPGVVSRSSSLSELPSELVHELEEMNRAGTLDHELLLDDRSLDQKSSPDSSGKISAAEKPQSPRIGTQCQSPWSRMEADLVSIPNPDAACALTDGQENSSNRNEPAKSQLPASQSPWTKGDRMGARSPTSSHLPTITEDVQGFYRRSSSGQSSAAQQSPWQEQDEATAPLSRKQNTSFYSPMSVQDDLLPSPATPSMSGGYPAPALHPIRPSTPETKPSSLPTPDFTFSIRSLRRFMSPSPEPLRPVRTDKNLKPALSNSWTKATRQHDPARHVRFVPLPGDEDWEKENRDPAASLGDSHADEDYIESGLPKRAVPRVVSSQPRRAASPPPDGSVTDLPGEVEKFRQHFAAVAGRRTTHAPRVPARLLPSDSQLVASSPVVGAMAERFLEADAQAAKAVLPLVAETAEREVPMGDVAVLDDDEDTASLDDVAAVLQNLDDYLGSCWDVDEEVARARDASNGLETGQDRVRVALEANVWI